MKLKSLLAIAIGSTLAATAMAHETHAPQLLWLRLSS